MIEVCFCSPNRATPCDYCSARDEIVRLLQNPLVEVSEDDFDRIFLNYNIGPKARLNILLEIEHNEYAG